jgi:hypothetical protein
VEDTPRRLKTPMNQGFQAGRHLIGINDGVAKTPSRIAINQTKRDRLGKPGVHRY